MNKYVKILLGAVGLLSSYEARKEARHIAKFLDRNVDVNEISFTVGEKEFAVPLPHNYAKYWYMSRCRDGLPHEMNVTSLFIECLNDASCFVDIGSHMGYFSFISAQYLDPKKVYSFEVSPYNFEMQSAFFQNLSPNSEVPIHLFNTGISNESGSLEIALDGRGDAGFGIHKVGNGSPQKGETVSVPLTRLDTFFADKAEKPDLIKIDVEGAEYNVLQGLGGILKDEDVKIFLEIHQELLPNYNATAQQVFDYLTSNGFKIFHIPEFRSKKQAHDEKHDLVELKDLSSLGINEMLFVTR